MIYAKIWWFDYSDWNSLRFIKNHHKLVNTIKWHKSHEQTSRNHQFHVKEMIFKIREKIDKVTENLAYKANPSIACKYVNAIQPAYSKPIMLVAIIWILVEMLRFRKSENANCINMEIPHRLKKWVMLKSRVAEYYNVLFLVNFKIINSKKPSGPNIKVPNKHGNINPLWMPRVLFWFTIHIPTNKSKAK